MKRNRLKPWLWWSWPELFLCGQLFVIVTGRCLDSCVIRSHAIWCRDFKLHNIKDCYRRYTLTTALDLSFTSLQVITNDTFQGLSRISVLNLDNIPAKNISLGAFSGFGDLKSISLRGIGPNVALFLPAIDFAGVPEIFLSRNFDNCTCEWRHILSYVREADITIADSHLLSACDTNKNITISGDCDAEDPVPPVDDDQWYKSPWLLAVIGLSVILLILGCLFLSKRRLKELPPFGSSPQNQLKPKRSKRSVKRMGRQISQTVTQISICPPSFGKKKPWRDITEYELAATASV